jgi:hypothetical protein
MLVRLVTPAAPGDAHQGIDEFEDELMNELGLNMVATYQPYRAGGAGGLADAANAAVNDAPVPTVIVTDGSMATDSVQAAIALLLNPIPIVQAVGGADYSGINYITGFYINAQSTCVDQLNSTTTQIVSILWDSSDTRSLAIKNYLDAHHPAGKILTWVSLAQLYRSPSIIDNSTFMLIPNANFYSKRQAIAKAVESRSVPAIYHEREYRNEHPQASRARINVHGHHVPFTFRQAAQLTGKILQGMLAVGTLPQMKEAQKDR